MKNFSTVGVRVAVATLLAGFMASASISAQAATNCEFRANAPDEHKVVRGDTLWGISGTFLEHPWCWPQVWGLNKEQIKDPHWIYPGQVIYFDRVNKRLTLERPGSVNGATQMPDGTTRLSPQIRTEGLGKDAIQSIASGVIDPFLSQPLVVDANEMKNAPRIVGSQDGHVNFGLDDKVYVRGALNGGASFQVFRPGTPLKDPETGKLVAYEAVYLGTVKLFAEAKAGKDVHTFIVGASKLEMSVGDLLMPAPPTAIRTYVPYQPETRIDARVMSIYAGVTHAGQSQVVSINRGSVDGIDVGAVLQLYTLGKTVHDRTVKSSMLGMKKAMVKLPDEQSGTLFIFRVFKNVSYGLIMQVTEPVEVGDVARSPE